MSNLPAIILFCVFFFVLPTLANEPDNCGNNKQAQLLVKLIKADSEQNRTIIRCNKLLTQAAKAKAEKMAEFGLVMHNIGGSPNSRLTNEGYRLPEYYGNEFSSNQVEAIAGGYASAEEVWEAFKSSDAHRSHLLAEHEFYVEQDEIGIAFVRKWESPHVEYWVVYLTKGFQQNQTYTGKVKDIPNKSSLILKPSNQK